MREPYDRGGFGTDTKPHHYEAIGRLISSFSSVEIATQDVFAHVSGINRSIVTAVIGGSRWADIVTQIKALMIWHPVHDEQMLQSALDDAAKMKKVRDIVAHYTWMTRGDEMLFTNGFFAKTVFGMQEHIFTVEYLKILADYRSSIAIRMMDSIKPHDDSHSLRAFPLEVVKQFRDDRQKMLLLKFPEPENPGGNTFSMPQKQKHPRKSYPPKSPEKK